jgi:hypothetical protein
VGVPQLGLNLGGGADAGPISGGSGNEESTGGGNESGVSNGDASDGGGSGGISTNEGNSAGAPGVNDDPVVGSSNPGAAGSGGDSSGPSARTANAADTCQDVAPTTATMLAIALVKNPAKVKIVELCGSQSALDARLRGALERNAVLVAALEASGHGIGAVVGVQAEDGSAVLFVTAE